MEQYFVIVFGVIVTLFVAHAIKYVSEEELIASPTIYSVIEDNEPRALDQFFLHSNEIRVLRMYGHSSSSFFVIKLHNFDFTAAYTIVINGEKMEIISNSDEILYDAGYSEKPLDFSGFVPIEIHLPFGDELGILVVLPNGIVVLTDDPSPISFHSISFATGEKWFIDSPSLDVQTTTPTTTSESINDDDYVTESTFDTDTTQEDTSRPCLDQSTANYPSTAIDHNHVVGNNERDQNLKTNHLNESNETTIVGKISVYSKTKISNFISFLNLTLS